MTAVFLTRRTSSMMVRVSSCAKQIDVSTEKSMVPVGHILGDLLGQAHPLTDGARPIDLSIDLPTVSVENQLLER